MTQSKQSLTKVISFVNIAFSLINAHSMQYRFVRKAKSVKTKVPFNLEPPRVKQTRRRSAGSLSIHIAMEVVKNQVVEIKKLWKNKRQLTFQALNLAMIVFSALMIWKGLMVVTKSESPVVVVLR